MRSGVLLSCALLGACGRNGFDPIDDAPNEVADSSTLPDVVPLAPCEVVNFEQAGINLWTTPPLSWRNDDHIVGFSANNLGIFTLRQGAVVNQTQLSPVGADTAELVITPAGYIAGWAESGTYRVRPLDSATNGVAPATVLTTTADFGRIARNGEEVAVVWTEAGDVWFQRVDLQGAPIAAKQPLAVGVVATGRYSLVTHRDGYALAMRGAAATSMLVRLSASGEILQQVAFDVPTTVTDLRIVSIGDDTLVAWQDVNQIVLTTIRGNGQVEQPRMVIEYPAAVGVTFGMAWTRERLAVVTSRNEAQTISVVLHWLDVSGDRLSLDEEIIAIPFTTTGRIRQPTVLGAPGRVLFTLTLEAQPTRPSIQGTFQRCY